MDICVNGDALLCDVLDIVITNVRERNVADAWIEYESHPLVRTLSSPKLKEPCIDCPIKSKCLGGCYARAQLILGDLYGPDPLCPRVESFLNESRVSA
jgi:pyrroloquinoline quinone biosynthesis protein E